MPDSLVELVRILASLGFLGAVVYAIVSDALSFRIPNAVSITIVALFAVWALLPGTDLDPIGRALAFGAVFTGGFILFAVGWMGGGDVKLVAALSLWLGLGLVGQFLLVMAILGGLLALVFLALKRLGALFPAVERMVPSRYLAGRRVPYGIPIGLALLVLAHRIPQLWVPWAMGQ